MKRFDCTSFDKRGVDGKSMEVSDTGLYVKHSDVEVTNKVYLIVARCTEQSYQSPPLYQLHIPVENISDKKAKPEYPLYKVKKVAQQMCDIHNKTCYYKCEVMEIEVI